MGCGGKPATQENAAGDSARLFCRTVLPILAESPTVNNNAVNEDTREITFMGDFQVTCINKPGSHLDPHSRIQFIGNQAGNWKLSEASAIRRIRNGTDTFFTLVNGKRANVVVAERNGTPYLKTSIDGTLTDNLLSQPECNGCKIIE
jgi:Protein of unknown function (DUF3892)